MVVMMLERVPATLRGELTKWMLEPRTGVFIGNVSALVRDLLWEKACQKAGDGAGVLAYSTNNEQGYELRMWGEPSRVIADYDGLALIRIPRPPAA